MSGKLTLENSGGWKHTLPALLLTMAAVLVLTWLAAVYLLSRLKLSEIPAAVVLVLVAYVLFRVFYPAVSRLAPQRKALRTVDWTLTEDALAIGDDVIPRSTIRQVHCWPNRDALGNRFAGWTVNIETTGKNRLLRSAADEKLAEASARQLRELVAALGYGGCWDSAEAGI